MPRAARQAPGGLVFHALNRAHYHTSGTGHLYQGRFKSFPIEADDHLLSVLRYVERNALRANLVTRAEDWRWSSLWRRVHGAQAARQGLAAWDQEKGTQLFSLATLPAAA